ncbi:MAG: gamma-glutamyltransferase family protein [Candidatus Zixiibacteriota bacterium]|nr:MAG: gamma-glutamyltransferase family protein [candidate division Zixibacteria bacterium]
MNRNFPYKSSRIPITAKNMVATSQPLAVQAGLEMMKREGSAMDAALAAAVTLTVVEPTGCGLGSDAFAIVWDGSKLHGVNGSGRSPAAWSYEKFSHLKEMPKTGWDTVTVPGAVSVWVALSEKFGKMPFETLFRNAVNHAENGFPVSPKIAAHWKTAVESYREFPEFIKTFTINGRAPQPGEMFKCPRQAETLREIAATKGESFYKGELAKKIAECSANEGGLMSLEDFANHKPDWVDPISAKYRGYDLYEIPPNGQGLAALVALGILENYDLKSLSLDSADSIHLQIEAVKIGFEFAKRHLADPEFMIVNYGEFLKPEFLKEQSARIKLNRVLIPDGDIPHDKGTVYLAAADENGMMVSFIQSNYMGFGSGVVIPETGIAMQNRGCGFSLQEGHPNQIDGGKRPYHTIIPGFVMKGNKPVLSFGVMGGHMQPQGHLQMMTRIFDYGQNPQAASDAPRWYWQKDNLVAVEKGFPEDVLEDLAGRGHKIVTGYHEREFGGAQLIYRAEGSYIAGSDHRKDGLAAGF